MEKTGDFSSKGRLTLTGLSVLLGMLQRGTRFLRGHWFLSPKCIRNVGVKCDACLIPGLMRGNLSVAPPPADAGALERLPGLPTAESAEDAELS